MKRLLAGVAYRGDDDLAPSGAVQFGCGRRHRCPGCDDVVDQKDRCASGRRSDGPEHPRDRVAPVAPKEACLMPGKKVASAEDFRAEGKMEAVCDPTA